MWFGHGVGGEALCGGVFFFVITLFSAKVEAETLTDQRQFTNRLSNSSEKFQIHLGISKSFLVFLSLRGSTEEDNNNGIFKQHREVGDPTKNKIL